jgi:hypothetical protein
VRPDRWRVALTRLPTSWVDENPRADDDQHVSGGSWRERSQFQPWPAPPPRRGPGPVTTAVARLLKLTLVLAVVAAVASGAFWLLEDEQGRADFERQLRDLPLVGELVPDPSDRTTPAPGSKQLGGGSGDGVVYPVK